MSRLPRFAGWAAASVLLVVACAAIAASFGRFAAEEAEAARHLAPSAEHWLGTDGRGRDALAVLLHGSRSMALLVWTTVLVSLVVGAALGGPAGWGGTLGDALLARAVELSSTLPTLIMLAVVRTWEGGDTLLAFALVLGLSRGVELGRLLRAELLALRSTDWVLAARALGASPSRILVRHVGAHVLSPLWVSVVLTAVHVVALETALTFTGFESDRPTWGTLLGDEAAPRAAASAALALAIATLGALYVLGRLLEARLDPRRRRRVPHGRGWARR
ncbi:MAG: ABC transporter permease subunit [Polyangiaceae bacterium]|nr:ABC transporter permease subunit [Polyangiaceae bacterium]